MEYNRAMNSLSDLTKKVGETAKKLGHNEDPKIIFLFMLEELGETARAFLKEEGYKENNNRIAESSEQELGDVFFLLLRLAYLKNIDLEAVLERTLKKLSASE